MVAPSLLRRIGAFLILFLLYQSAEGVGARVLHNGAAAAVIMVGALLAAWPAGKWLGYKGYDAYGLDLKTGSARLVLGGLIVMAALRLAAAFAGLANGVYSLASLPVPASWAATAMAVAGAAVSTFIPSLAEDILTRGFWLKASGIRWSGPAFVAATAAIYVLNHVYRLGDGPMEWLRLFCFGIAYAAACWKWQNLWAAVGLHWGWNLTNAILDATVNLDAVAPGLTAVYSAGAHLMAAALVLLWPVSGKPGALRAQ